MAKHDRIELKKIDEAIRDVTRKLKAARTGAGTAHRAHLDSLAEQLATLSQKTQKICSRTYAVWPPEDPGPEPTYAPSKRKPGKAKPKPQPKRKPSRPKKSS